MKKMELEQAWTMANDESIDLSGESMVLFEGFGLPGFKPVYVTIKQLAKLIRWQCQYINGGWDLEELNSITRFGKRHFMILN